MNLVIGFAPFILFALLSRLSADLALWVAFAAAFVVTIRDFVESPSLRLLDAGSLVLFAAAGAGARVSGSQPVAGAGALHRRSRPVPAAGRCRWLLQAPFLAGICAAGSARSGMAACLVPARSIIWSPSPGRRLSWPWPLADGAVAFDPRLPLYASIAVSVIALGLAVTFTLRYPALAAKRLNG